MPVFCLDNQDHFILDTDIVFVQDETVTTMLRELKAAEEDVWAIQARFTVDGKMEVGWGSLDKGGSRKFQNIAFGNTIEEVQQGQPLKALPLPAVMADRIHPCCCLIKNSEAFRLTAHEIGFSCAHFEESGGGKVYDTMGVATQVMKTHGWRYILSSKMVKHFWGVACNKYPEKDAECQKMLAEIRSHVA